MKKRTMPCWTHTLLLMSFLTASGLAVAESSNVFRMSDPHDGEVSTSPRTSTKQKQSCAAECSTEPRGKLRCTLICKCKLKCAERYTQDKKNYRPKRFRCRRKCPGRAAKKVQRRRERREAKKKATEKEQTELAEITRSAQDAETLASLINVASDLIAGPILRSSAIAGGGGSSSSCEDFIPYALPIFNPAEAMQTYGSCWALQRDIGAAVAHEVNRALCQCNDGDDASIREREFAVDMALEDAITTSIPSVEAGAKVEVTEDSFKTNTQERSVDEDDVVKSDGTYIHVAYGHEIVTTTKDGEVRARTDVRPARNDTNGTLVDVRGQVQGLLLNDCVLAAVVTGYTYNYLYCDVEGQEVYEPPILSDMGSTSLRLYDACDVPTDGNSSLTELNSFDLRGRFVDSRGINNTVHVVSQSNIQQGLSHYINAPLSRWNSKYRGMNCSEYQAKAANDSISLIRDFGNRLVKEISSVAGPNCSNVARITAFATGMEGAENAGSAGAAASSSLLPDIWNGEPIIGSLTSITSVNLESVDLARTVQPATSSGWFKGYASTVYSSVDRLFLAANSYRFSGRRGGEQSTYLISCELKSDGRPSVWGATGIVPGYTKDSYSMSERHGYLRIATTSNERLACRANPKLGDNSTEEDWCRSWCCHGWETVANSTSQLMILDVAGGNGKMEMVANVTGLGETEEIKSVRYFETFAIIVTFRRTDPLYTIDLTNNTATLLGELKITGYSSYMQQYPTDDGSRLLLALGQDADPETGRDLGLQISIFNITDLLQPTLVIRHNIEGRDQSNKFSSSEAQFEPKALRFLPISKYMIIPAYIGSKENSFDGFLVFNVTPSAINQTYAISMVDGNLIRQPGVCWTCAYVQSRSIVISGDATFIKGHAMKNIALTDGASNWNATLDPQVIRKEGCCGYFWTFRPTLDICAVRGPLIDIARPAVDPIAMGTSFAGGSVSNSEPVV